MLPRDVSPAVMKAGQEVLKAFSKLYPSDRNRKLFPEMIDALQFCFDWNFTTEEIIDALARSQTHPFWSDLLSKGGSLTGFLKPRHLETVRHYVAETSGLEEARRQDRREVQDEKRARRQKRKGFDEEGNPILYVQRAG
jgi:hypothetical protein